MEETKRAEQADVHCPHCGRPTVMNEAGRFCPSCYSIIERNEMRAERLNVRERPYHVWRRSDGYVSVTRGEPRNGRDSFDVLLITDDWPTARAAVEKNRDEGHDAVVRSWDQ